MRNLFMLPITRSGTVKHNMPAGKPHANKKPANKKQANIQPTNIQPTNEEIPLENIRCVKTPIRITTPIIVK